MRKSGGLPWAEPGRKMVSPVSTSVRPVALLLVVFYLASAAYYFFVRFTSTLGKGGHPAYGYFVVAVELLGLSAMVPYACLLWRVSLSNKTPGLPPAGQALEGAELEGSKMEGGRPGGSKHKKARSHPGYVVHVMVPCYKESLQVISSTVRAALEAQLPAGCQRTVYLCDDGNSPDKRSWVEELQQAGSEVVYVSGRTRKKGEMNGKSANLNNCLKNYIYAHLLDDSGQLRRDAFTEIPLEEVVVVFDADMACRPNFFLKVLEVMEDGRVGLCLTPQSFSNVDPAGDLFNNINKQFWEYILPGSDPLGYVACTGTNFCVRGQALVSAGLFPEYTITEDYALGMELAAAGWRGAYLNEYLAVGEAPDEIRNVMRQRSRWTKGHMQVFFSHRCPLFNWRLSAANRWLYTNGTWAYFATIVATPTFVIVPFISLLFGIHPLAISWDFALAASAYYVATFLLQSYCRKPSHSRSLWFAGISNHVLCFTFFKAVLNVLLATIGAKARLAFKATDKAGQPEGLLGRVQQYATLKAAATMRRAESLVRAMTGADPCTAHDAVISNTVDPTTPRGGHHAAVGTPALTPVGSHAWLAQPLHASPVAPHNDHLPVPTGPLPPHATVAAPASHASPYTSRPASPLVPARASPASVGVSPAASRTPSATGSRTPSFVTRNLSASRTSLTTVAPEPTAPRLPDPSDSWSNFVDKPKQGRYSIPMADMTKADARPRDVDAAAAGDQGVSHSQVSVTIAPDVHMNMTRRDVSESSVQGAAAGDKAAGSAKAPAAAAAPTRRRRGGAGCCRSFWCCLWCCCPGLCPNLKDMQTLDTHFLIISLLVSWIAAAVGIYKLVTSPRVEGWILLPTFWALYNAIPPYLYLHYTISKGWTFRAACAVCRVLCVLLGAASLASLWFAAQPEYDLHAVLRDSLSFLDGARSGSLPPDTRSEVPWRGESGLMDGSDVGTDLSGGWFTNPASNIKATLPIAMTTALLAWGMLEFPKGFEAADGSGAAEDQLRWGSDYLMRARLDAGRFVAQVGDFRLDQNAWLTAEQLKGSAAPARPTFVVGNSTGGADATASAAAALAAAALALQPTSPEWSNQTLFHAQQLYSLAAAQPPLPYCDDGTTSGSAPTGIRCTAQQLMSVDCVGAGVDVGDVRRQLAALLAAGEGVPGVLTSAGLDVTVTEQAAAPGRKLLRAASRRLAQDAPGASCIYSTTATALYPTTTVYDDLAWAAAWLYKATGETRYLLEAEDHLKTHLAQEAAAQDDTEQYIPSYANVRWGAEVLLSTLGRDPASHKEAMRTFFQVWLTGHASGTHSSIVSYTRKGLAWTEGSPLPNAAAASLLAVMHAQRSVGPTSRTMLRCWARDQLRYAVGDVGRSYLAGFGHRPPTQVQARSAVCADPATCDLFLSWRQDTPNAHVMQGALVAGPDRADRFVDSRTAANTAATTDGSIAVAANAAALLQLGVDEALCSEGSGLYQQIQTEYQVDQRFKDNVKLPHLDW